MLKQIKNPNWKFQSGFENQNLDLIRISRYQSGFRIKLNQDFKSGLSTLMTPNVMHDRIIS